MTVHITTDKQRYLPRELVKMNIQTTGPDGKPLPANLSLAVVDDKLFTLANDQQHHILSWLLVGSELKGKIEEPAFYFKKEEPKAAPALDLVMLTHGYRYFDFMPYVLENNQLKFTGDLQNVLGGLILDTSGHPIAAKVFLVNAVTGISSTALHQTTGNDGQFFFHDLQKGNFYLVAQALKQRCPVSITVMQNGIGYNPIQPVVVNKQLDYARERSPGKTSNFQPPLPVKKPNQVVANGSHLSEVVVTTAYGIQRSARSLSSSTSRVVSAELLNTGYLDQALAGKVSGLQVTQSANPGAVADIHIRGARSLNGNDRPLFVLDGIAMNDPGLLNVNDIESVTIMKDAAATAIFGGAAVNGVIMIESKKLRGFQKVARLESHAHVTTERIQINGPVFTVARQFYAPRYDGKAVAQRDDFRETIYWNPVVQTDDKGKASLSFYNADATTVFRAVAEGIGYNGMPGRAEATYAVQNLLSVDAKIPPYLTVGDSALIPVVIRNASAITMQARLAINAPAQAVIGKYNAAVQLSPGASTQVLIPLQALAPMHGELKITVSVDSREETIVLPVAAVAKGFPVIATFSGIHSASHPFVINNAVPGTVNASLKLIENVEGELLNGIESMLREPAGCFEQTSSTTYPNISILKYLKESGKSNPAIEQKALAYISNGYKRLIGFETAQHGFEWFGHTPPHEALTAYGLLEFTDMKQFIPVDEQMLQRTRKFLLSRRDGKGGFLQASGGYDHFAAVPNRIANCYIVYALTKAGVGKEIQREYDAAVQKAIESKDGYLMGMMALAAHEMKDQPKYYQLMQLLNQSYQSNGLQSATSVVNSRDQSLKIEAMALYTLALAKEASPRLALMSELVTKIVQRKSYYGYGSTQATVLALQAVVAYYRLVQVATEQTVVNFSLNGQPVSPGKLLAGQLINGKNDFSVSFEGSGHHLPYNFEVAYYTNTPPNSVQAPLAIGTSFNSSTATIGETVRMDISVQNKQAILQPMAIAKIGIPAGLEVQAWQLKEIMEKHAIAYYEIFDNYLVFYWMGFAEQETKTIRLDLKATIPGTYKAKASNVYLYYTPEYKHWNEGSTIQIIPAAAIK